MCFVASFMLKAEIFSIAHNLFCQSFRFSFDLFGYVLLVLFVSTD